MKIFGNLSLKNNRLPKDTSNIISKPRYRRVPFVSPEAFVQNNPRIQQNLKAFETTSPTQIRDAARARITEQVVAVNRQIAKQSLFKGLTFAVHEESGRSFAVIKNQKTGQVLKQIPTNDSLSQAGLLKNASGLLKNFTI